MNLPQSWDLAFYVVGSYRDFLKEEIDINRLMLYREECIHPDTRPCLHNENLLCKIGELEKELADYKDQLAA